jgi:hypothetical protein
MATLPTELSFGRRNRTGFAQIKLNRLPHRAGKAFENAFDDMVVVLAVEQLDMQGNTDCLRN